MLSDKQRRAITAGAIAELRAEWGRNDTRSLGDVIAEIHARMTDGTFGQVSFVEEASETVRRSHAADMARRDSIAARVADHIETLQFIAEMDGAAGVRDYTTGNALDVEECVRLLDGPEAAID